MLKDILDCLVMFVSVFVTGVGATLLGLGGWTYVVMAATLVIVAFWIGAIKITVTRK